MVHLGRSTKEEMLIIPQAEALALLKKHSVLLMEDGRLSHAARLAAKQERLLTDPTLPDDVAMEHVKPVDRQLHCAIKKLRQLQTQPLTAEEEVQEGQELLTPALSKWMRLMVRAAAAQPQEVPTAPPEPTLPPHRRLLPQVPHVQTQSDTKRKTPPSLIPIASQRRRRHRLEVPPSEMPKRAVAKKPSRLPVQTPPSKPSPATKRSRLPVPSKPFTPKDLMGVTLKPTPATKTSPSPRPQHLKSSITPKALTKQSTQLKKVGPPRTTRQTNPLMVTLACAIDKR